MTRETKLGIVVGVSFISLAGFVAYKTYFTHDAPQALLTEPAPPAAQVAQAKGQTPTPAQPKPPGVISASAKDAPVLAPSGKPPELPSGGFNFPDGAKVIPPAAPGGPLTPSVPSPTGNGLPANPAGLPGSNNPQMPAIPNLNSGSVMPPALPGGVTPPPGPISGAPLPGPAAMPPLPGAGIIPPPAIDIGKAPPGMPGIDPGKLPGIPSPANPPMPLTPDLSAKGPSPVDIKAIPGVPGVPPPSGGLPPLTGDKPPIPPALGTAPPPGQLLPGNPTPTAPNQAPPLQGNPTPTIPNGVSPLPGNPSPTIPTPVSPLPGNPTPANPVSPLQGNPSGSPLDFNAAKGPASPGAIPVIPAQSGLTTTNIPLPGPQPVPAAGPAKTQVEHYDAHLYQCTAEDADFAALSKKFYNGSDRYTQALIEYNRDSLGGDATSQAPRVIPGTKVLVPPLHVLESKYPNVIAGIKPIQTVTPKTIDPIPSTPPKALVPVTNGPATGSPVPPVQPAVAPWAGQQSQPPAQPQPIQPIQPVQPAIPPPSAAPGFGPAGPVSGANTPTPGAYVVPPPGKYYYQIAQEALGNPSRWSEIYQLNQQYDPSNIVPAGTQLRLPGTTSTSGWKESINVGGVEFAY